MNNKNDLWPTRSADEFRAQACDRQTSTIAGLPLEVKGYPNLLRERDVEPTFAPVNAKQ